MDNGTIDGARLAADIRQRANKLTPEQRREHFRQAMAMIYAGEKLGGNGQIEKDIPISNPPHRPSPDVVNRTK